MAEKVEIVIEADDKASDALEGVNAGLLNMSSMVNVAGAAWDAVTGVIGAAVDAVWSFVEAAGESEVVNMRLDSTLSALGETATVTFGGMTEDMQKELDKMAAAMAKANDELLSNQQDYQEKQKTQTRDIFTDLTRMDQDYQDKRARMQRDAEERIRAAEQRMAAAKTAAARQSAAQSLAEARREAGQRLADYDADYQKKRARFQQDTARDLADQQAAYDKEQAQLQASLDEMQSKVASANKATAQQVATIYRPTKEQITSLADEISKLGGFDDEELISGMTKLLNFGALNADQFAELSRLAADLSARTGQDLATSFQQLGMAIETGDFGRLKRQIGDLTDAQKAEIKAAQDSNDTLRVQSLVIDALVGKFGTVGAATAQYGATLQGQMGKFTTLMGNIQENIGGAILPAITGALQTLMPYLQQAGDAFGRMLGDPAMQAQIRAFGEWIGTQFVPLLQQGITWLGTNGPTMMTNLQAWFTTNSPQIKQTADSVSSAITNIGSAVSSMWTVVGPALTLFAQGWKIQIEIFARVKQAFDATFDSISKGIAELQRLAGALPDWLTPGSPTPLEIGLRGIKDAMTGVSSQLNTAGVGMASLNYSGAGISSGYGGAPVTVVYSPAMSLGNQAEFESQFVPMLRQAMARVNRGKV